MRSFHCQVCPSQLAYGWGVTGRWVQGALCQAHGPRSPQHSCHGHRMAFHTNTLSFRPASVPLHAVQRQSSSISAPSTHWTPWPHPPLVLWRILPFGSPRILLSSGQAGPGHSHYRCQWSSTRQGLEGVEASEEQKVFSRLDSSSLLWREEA